MLNLEVVGVTNTKIYIGSGYRNIIHEYPTSSAGEYILLLISMSLIEELVMWGLQAKEYCKKKLFLMSQECSCGL
jgi:hypothetical protein